MKLDALQAAKAERCEAVVMLQASELTPDSGATSEPLPSRARLTPRPERETIFGLECLRQSPQGLTNC